MKEVAGDCIFQPAEIKFIDETRSTKVIIKCLPGGYKDKKNRLFREAWLYEVMTKQDLLPSGGKSPTSPKKVSHIPKSLR